MKRITGLLVVALAVSFALSAEEKALIDFNTLVVDFTGTKDNKATMVDFSDAAGSSFTQAQKDQMKTSLAINKWDTKLNSSANSVVNAKDSVTQPVKVKDKAVKYAGQTVLGVRVRFPSEAWNSVVDIRPPFEIPAYSPKTDVAADGKLTPSTKPEDANNKFDGFGVLKNVGVIKFISANVFGNNFPHLLSVILQDQTGENTEYKLGYLNFDGWKTLTYENANYVTDVRNREIRVYPLYPSSSPYVKLIGFRVYKDGSNPGGDFVGYIKDIYITYDKALVAGSDRDIDDEATWGILQAREEGRRKAELDRLGNIQVMRMLESSKMDTSTKPTAGNTAATTTTTPATTTPAK